MKFFSIFLMACLVVPNIPSSSVAGSDDLKTKPSTFPKVNQQSDWVRITCLSERDSFSTSEQRVETKFLVESLRDTFQIEQLISSCGCEIGEFKRDNLIFPGKPDTIKIHSDISQRPGQWKKYQKMYVSTGKTAVLYTGPWRIYPEK